MSKTQKVGGNADFKKVLQNRRKIKQMEKEFEVSLNFSQIVEAENEEEAKEEMRKIFDSTLLNWNVKEYDSNTTLKISFKENLSYNSIKSIKECLWNVLRFETEIEEI